MPLKLHTIFVLCSACICLVLVLAARHHPPSRRKIKEIWHGRVHWEEDSKTTTMLRSSAEESLAEVPVTKSEESLIKENVTPKIVTTSHEVFCQPHVVFTTFKCPKCDSLRQTIEDNTLHTWSKMNDVTFKVIANAKTNEHGVPILGDMYTKMFHTCPDAQTYTYVNGDIMGTSDFVETLEAVQPIGDFLMVGKRTNVPWSENHDAKHTNFNFDSHFRRGALFRSDAQDYFTVTKNAIDLKTIPPFVVGRPGYDNWLVDHIYHNSKVALIDATKTVSMIHQTDSDGNVAHGGDMVKSSSDREYNRRIGKGQWDHGHTHHAEWETGRFDGKIVLKNRKSGKVFKVEDEKTTTQLKSWTVLVTVSTGFDDMFSNWWFYYSKLNLGMDVIMIAEDKSTYEKYLSIPGIEVQNAQYDDSKETKSFSYNTVQYNKLVSRRASHILRVLDSKPNIIYTDIDTVWLQDPRPYFTGKFDLWAQLDNKNYYCTGFMAIIKSDKMVHFLKDWNEQLRKKPQLNQPIFNKIIHQSHLNHKALPLKEFPSGKLYFQEKKRDGVVSVHNNFIIGKEKKIERFQDIGLWHSSTSVNQNERVRVTEPPEGTQMGREQIQEILSVLPKDGNLLVWGLGNDSPFWHDSTEGKVVFIEDDFPDTKSGTLWLDVITAKYPFLEAHTIHYTTDTVKSYDKYMQHSELWDIDLDIRDQLPESVTNTRWDVILVDAPLGCCNVGPGRYQSIYTSKLLSNSDTHVFVDDYERKVEKQFSLKVYAKQPLKIIKRQEAASNANAQAHFVQVSASTEMSNTEQQETTKVSTTRTKAAQPCSHIITDAGGGFFSNMLGAIAGLAKYGPHVLVRWSSKLYLAPNSDNVWTQYFEPPSNCIPDASTQQVQMAGWDWKFKDTEAMLSPQAQRIQLNDAMVSELEKYKWSSKHVLGVHVRSTDRSTDSVGLNLGLKVIPDERYVKNIRQYLETHPETEHIFVASDYQPSLNVLKQTFGNKITHINAVRSSGSASIHHGHITKPFDAGKSAVLDAWLLSKTDYKILSVSNLNVFAILLQGETAGFTLLNEIDGYKRYRDLFANRDRNGTGKYLPNLQIVSGINEAIIATPLTPLTISYDGEVWETPSACAIEPVSHATVLPPNGQVRNKTGVYGFGKWYWEQEHRGASNPLMTDEPILSLVQVWNKNFQHIVFDTLPKLTFVCPFLHSHPRVQVLVMNILQRDLVIEACPISKARFVVFANAIRAPVVYIPYFVGDDLKMGIVPPNSVRPLGSQTTPGSNVVYLARKAGTTRSVANEADVLATLRTQWPELRVVYPTNDWRQNRESVRNAGVIIGPHGGAMANMIFAPVNTTIIEFLPLVQYKHGGKNERPCYFGLAHGLGFEYHAVAPSTFDFDHGTMVVPTKRLNALIKQFTTSSVASAPTRPLVP